jgi:hypothetical protein
MAMTIARAPRVARKPGACLGALGVAFVLCLAGRSSAADGAKGVEQHDGFMLRFSIGLGYGSGSESQPILGDLTLSGGAGFFSFDIGGALAENLVLHGRLSDMVVVNPKVSVNGEELGTADDASLTFYLIGAGLTYYLMPANVYFTGVVGIAKAKADNGTTTAETSDAGFGLEGDIGKEWWVSDNWGLGIAGRFTFASVPDDLGGGDSTTLHGLGFGVLFSATYQ